MKTALSLNGKKTIPASATAPTQAKCPHCDCTVSLRRRKLMGDNGYAYFWRHPNNVNYRCGGRHRPYYN